MDKNTVISINFKADENDPDSLTVSIEAKNGITVGYVCESLAGFLQQLEPLYNRFPDKPFSGIEGAKKK